MPLSAQKLDRLSDKELLQLRFCELPVRLAGTSVAARARHVFKELSARGIKVKPSIWLAEEWFNPNGTVGFAIPFYLAHPRLARLEQRLMLEAEGLSEGEALSIIRHETGHAIDEAFQFHRRAEYARVFGSPNREYPSTYTAVPNSRDHVMHLNAWYAQSHPVEDFAETFATWLLPKRAWQNRYRDWPALEKLEVVDRWLVACKGRLPRVTRIKPTGELSSNERTLKEHYEEKRAFYKVGASRQFDAELKRIFAPPPRPKKGARVQPTAVSVLRTIRAPVRKTVARPLGIPAYTVDQVLRQVILRARALDLKQAKPAESTLHDVVRLVSRMTSAILRASPRLPL